MHIRRIADTDIQACATLCSAAWATALPDIPRSISKDVLEAETLGEMTLVATRGDRICGLVSVWEADWFIHHLFVDPDAQGQGVGSALLGKVEGLAKNAPLRLKCLTANASAMGFYTSVGFTKTDTHGTDQYGDWVLLQKTPA